MLTLASFFSGCGGLDLGFHQAGFRTVWANEMYRWSARTYAKNFPGVHLDTRNMLKIPRGQMPGPGNSIDGVVGGPPCQSWSTHGNRNNVDDPRGKLFFEYVDAIAQIKPRFFLAENVKGMLMPLLRPKLYEIQRNFEELGYELKVNLLNFGHYGVAQNRERVIIVGLRKGSGVKFRWPGRQPFKYLKDVIYDLRDLEPGDPGCPQAHERRPALENRTSVFHSKQMVRGWEEVSRTICSTYNGLPLHPDSPPMVKSDRYHYSRGGTKTAEWDFGKPLEANRTLSVRECMRIQGFPDSFEICYPEPREAKYHLQPAYHQVGNAVPPSVAKLLAEGFEEV